MTDFPEVNPRNDPKFKMALSRAYSPEELDTLYNYVRGDWPRFLALLLFADAKYAADKSGR